MQSYKELIEIQKSLLGNNHCKDVDLSNLPYWPYGESHPNCTLLNGNIPVGTFYHPYCILDDDDISLLKSAVGSVGESELIFVPHLRASDESCIKELRELGFSLICAEGESIVDPKNRKIADFLREQIGNKTYRDHLRLVRRAQDFEIRKFTYDELNNDALLSLAWCNLFNQHEQKYNNNIVPYGKVLLDKLKGMNCRHEYRFNVRFHGNEVVQVYLTRKDNNTLYLIASAIKRDSIPSGVNLYTTMMMDVLNEYDVNGIEKVHLGRGGKKRKLKYGANCYLPHVHAVYTKNKAASLELELEESI
ncbi:hypothetical protein [Aeromonas jandaei]|uniref:hypothetical protein n=1 Tax=Aeromonas jandaei TaxID=650 RepID=UPI003BA2BD2D